MEKRIKKKRNRERILNPDAMDHLVTYYDPHGAYGRPILKPYAHMEIGKVGVKRK